MVGENLRVRMQLAGAGAGGFRGGDDGRELALGVGRNALGVLLAPGAKAGKCESYGSHVGK